MSNRLKEIVDEIQFRKKWTVEQVAESIGYSRVHLTRLMKKGGSPEFEQRLLGKHRDVLQNVSHENHRAGPTKEQDLPGDDITKQILFNLSESHKALAIAHQEISKSNRIMMEREQKQAIDYGSPETLVAVGGKLEALLEAIIAVGTGKKWKSSAEARAELSKIVSEKQEAV